MTVRPPMAMGRRLHWIDDHTAVLADAGRVQQIRDNIAAGDIYIARRQFDAAVLEEIRAYLEAIGRGSLPNYSPIVPGAPNFHRMNRNDSRAYIPGCFHQFVFFPWNQDPFDLFKMCAAVYHMKNRLIYFNAACPPGVAPIDPDAPLRWTTFSGRWMLLFAGNRLAGNAAIGNAVPVAG
jgi:hypothetical protein